MVGQSFDVAVLASMAALSIADVTALIWSGDPLAGLCAEALPTERARAASSANATEAPWDRRKSFVATRPRGLEKTADGKHIILSLPSIQSL